MLKIANSNDLYCNMHKPNWPIRIQDKMKGYYVHGKISEDHRQFLKDRIFLNIMIEAEFVHVLITNFAVLNANTFSL